MRLSDYTALCKPQEIEDRSLAIIDAEVPEYRRPCTPAEWPVLRRMIHASADYELLDLVRFHPQAVEAGIAALRSGARIVADTRMAQSGLTMRRLEPMGCTGHCLMDDKRVAAEAARLGITRAMASVDLALAELPADVWAIGNAPTALLRLLERLEQGAPVPKLIIGMPVGFVSAEESKALLESASPAPYITIQGRKGGSALAAAALNALAILAAEEAAGTEK